MKNKNKIIVATGIILFTIMVAGITLHLITKGNNKPLDNNNIVTNQLQILDIKNTDKPLDLIKTNVVKIINKVKNNEITGTGFFIENGYLLTNSHVVDIKGDITVEYSDGKTSRATLVSNEIVSDIAILKVDSVNALALPLGETLSIKSTDDLYAIGYAFDLKGEASITKGILSARRSIAGIEYLQTDAAINRGFSGGPLLNSKGEVVGMNSLANENATIGMAISVETLQNVVYKLINNKETHYLTTDRPSNALSSVLKETGQKIDDLYDEWKYFHEGEEKPNDSKEEVKPPKQLSTVSQLKYLGVKGYDIGWSQNSSSSKFRLFYTNNENKVDLIITPKDSNATYQVKGNENLQNEVDGVITVTVTAEDGIHKSEYYILYYNVKTYIENLSSAYILSQVEKNYQTNTNVLQYHWGFKDVDGISIHGYYKIDNFKVDLYACNKGLECESDDDYVFLKTYTFYQDGSLDAKPRIELSEIKDMLNSGNYFKDGTVKLCSKSTLTTLSQGSFSSKSYEIIYQ